MSRIRRTRRTHEDTSGHDDPRNHVQEDTGGHVGTRADTTYAGSGTVRPRVQIPGPRPVSESRSVRYTFTRDAPGSPPCHSCVTDFGKTRWRPARLRVVRNPRLNSRLVTGQPIYQHAHGPRTVRHPGFENPTVERFIKSRPLQRSHVALMPNYARCMAQKWRVNVTTGAPDEAKAQDIVRRLPDDSRPAYIGYGDDLALRIVAVSVEANDEGTARTKAIRLVKDACRAVDWDWEPEARRITAA